MTYVEAPPAHVHGAQCDYDSSSTPVYTTSNNGPFARTPWLPPVGLGIATVLATVYVALGNPNTNAHPFPLCPLKYVTGVDCPACGGLRAVYSMTHGDLLGAADHNLLVLLGLPLAVLGYVWWLGRTLGFNLPRLSVPSWVTPVVITIVTVFSVARNIPIPGHDFLNSALS